MNDDMHDQTNSEIEAALNELASLCCATLKGEESNFIGRQEGLLKTLVMSGYVWKAERTLMEEVEQRVKQLCPESTLARGGELSSLTSALGKKFKTLAQWESHTPNDKSPAKAANISAATDA